MKKDKASVDAAKHIAKTVRDGEQITLVAAVNATEGIIKILENMKTKEGKIMMLQDNALFMGIASQFMETVVPQMATLQERARADGLPENSTNIIYQVWLGKVFKDIYKGVEKHEKENS